MTWGTSSGSSQPVGLLKLVVFLVKSEPQSNPYTAFNSKRISFSQAGALGVNQTPAGRGSWQRSLSLNSALPIIKAHTQYLKCSSPQPSKGCSVAHFTKQENHAQNVEQISVWSLNGVGGGSFRGVLAPKQEHIPFPTAQATPSVRPTPACLKTPAPVDGIRITWHACPARAVDLVMHLAFLHEGHCQ